MRLEDYIKECLKDPEFRKYWIEDGLPTEFDEKPESGKIKDFPTNTIVEKLEDDVPVKRKTSKKSKKSKKSK